MYTDIYARMKVDVPVGEVGGMKIEKFEVVHPSDYTKEHEQRGNVTSPLAYMRLVWEGRAPEPGWYTGLAEKGVGIWMSDTTAERRDHVEPVMAMQHLKAERVVINGLGIGMVLSAALTMDHVKHVDVVERDQRVIDLVGPHYLKDPRVRIHHADAFEQMKKWAPDKRWDVGWTDIWPDICPDNLSEMKQFTDFYGARCAMHGNWSEDIAKRYVWDNYDEDDDLWSYLTEQDIEAFENDDEDAEWDEEDED